MALETSQLKANLKAAVDYNTEATATFRNTIRQSLYDALLALMNDGGLTSAFTTQLTAISEAVANGMVDGIRSEWVDILADQMEIWIKTGVVSTTVAAGISVKTAGTAAAQTGATDSTGEGTGDIS